MADELTLDDEADSFEQIGTAATRVVEKISPLGPVEKIPVGSRTDWLNLRKSYVTASDIGSICGVGRRSPLAVWAEKTGRVPGTEDNAVMQKGRWFEPAIFEAMREKVPDWQVQRAKVFLAANDHRIGATPDGVATIPGVNGIVIIQGKVVARQQFREKWLSDPDDDFSEIIVPLEYQLQTLTEGMLAGAETSFVAALVHDSYTADLHLLPVPRHPAAEEKILARVGLFWADTDAGREPEAMPSKDEETIKALYPRDNGTEIDLSGDNEVPGLVAEYEDLGKTASAADKRRKEVRTSLAAKMRTAESARLSDGRRLTLKASEVKGYYVEPRVQRTLRVAKR